MTPNIFLRKKFIILIFSILILCSCKEATPDEPPVDAVGKMENEKIELLESLKTFGSDYADAWSGKDPAAVAAFFAPDGSLKVNDESPAIGREAITAVAKGFMEAFPDMVVVMDSLVQHHGSLEFHWTLTGTYNGSEGPENHVRISGVERWQLNKDGLVQSSVGSFDADDYNRQISRQ